MWPTRVGVALLLLAVAAAQRVPLRDVESLLFEAGRMTAGRRAAPVPQMVQTNHYSAGVRSIFCRNAGWDGRRVHWECRLPDGVPARLGAFEIECEGYDYAGDPNHLAGSCGIRYELLPAAAGARAAPAAPGGAATGFMPTLVGMAFLILVGSVCYCAGAGGRADARAAETVAPATGDLLDLGAPEPWKVAAKGSDDGSGDESDAESDVDYGSLPPSRASSREGSPVLRRRAPARAPALPPAPAATHVHVHAPAPAYPGRDPFVDLAMAHILTARPRPAAPTIVVQPPAPAAAPAPAPAAGVAHGASSTARGPAYEPAVEYGKPAKAADSWWAGASSTGAAESGWSERSATGASTTR